VGLPWFFSADTLQKQTFTKTRGILSVNPLYLSGNYVLAFFLVSLTVKNKSYLPSTNSPKLTLCSSLSKDKLSDGLGVATMLSRLKSTHAFKQELFSGLE
jgi:hypothetical protein